MTPLGYILIGMAIVLLPVGAIIATLAMVRATLQASAVGPTGPIPTGCPLCGSQGEVHKKIEKSDGPRKK